MPDCDYCEQSFPDEGALLQHMADAHEGELGRIDRRRVEEHVGGDGEGLSTTVTYAIVGIVIVAVIGGAVYAAVGAFGGGPEQRIHEHGTINVTVDGEPVDFQQPQYRNAQGFHFHAGDDRWHMHPAEPGRLTIAEAMSRLGIELTEDSITIEGTTYDATDPDTTITVRIDGEPVGPDHELHDGEHLEIHVESG